MTVASIQRRYAFLLESAADAMLLVNDEDVIVLVNSKAEHCFGYPRGEMIGRKLTAVLPAAGERGAVVGRRKDGSAVALHLGSGGCGDGELTAIRLEPVGAATSAAQALQDLEINLPDILDFSPEAVVVADDEGRIAIVNAEAGRLFGYQREDLVGRPIEILVPTGFRPRHQASRETYAARPVKRAMGEGATLFGVRRDGSEVPVEISLSPIDTPAGRVVAGVVRDVSVRKEADDRLARAEARYRGLLEAAPDAMVVADASGRIVLVNLQVEQQFGHRREDLIGQPVNLLIPDGLDGRGSTDDGPDSGSANSGVLALTGRRRDGEQFPIEVRVSSNADPAGPLITAAIRDISARRRAESFLAEKVAEGIRLNAQLATALQLAYAAEHDVLTGLPNRKLLHDRIGQAISLASRHGAAVAVLFLDLDGFKRINDSLGHAVGDRLLQQVASRLESGVRASDTVSRQGGDEFVILLPEVRTEHDVERLVVKLLKSVAEPYRIEPHELHITASVGASLYPADGMDPETLIKNADTAMYQAKEDGRQGYRLFKPAMSVRAVERLATEELLRGALERRQFILHYQPQISLRTGGVTGAEALIRWRHPTRGVLEPSSFLSIAEDSGLMIAIGAWVLREACGQARSWTSQGYPPMTMAVNVSAMEFAHPGFIAGVLDTLEETEFDPSLLELELAESVLMRQPDAAVRVLNGLREAGVRIAIDGFGAGYSSLSHLTKVPVDALKIDPSFMRDLPALGRDAIIVEAVIGMAHALGLRVVAEGVETAEQAEFLVRRNCDHVQGHFFGPPAPAEAFAQDQRPSNRAIS